MRGKSLKKILYLLFTILAAALYLVTTSGLVISSCENQDVRQRGLEHSKVKQPSTITKAKPN